MQCCVARCLCIVGSEHCMCCPFGDSEPPFPYYLGEHSLVVILTCCTTVVEMGSACLLDVLSRTLPGYSVFCVFLTSKMPAVSVGVHGVSDVVTNGNYLADLLYQISTEQTSVLGSKPRYIRKMLQLVQTRMESHVIDITLKFTLSALWNLTGEWSVFCWNVTASKSPVFYGSLFW